MSAFIAACRHSNKVLVSLKLGHKIFFALFCTSRKIQKKIVLLLSNQSQSKSYALNTSIIIIIIIMNRLFFGLFIVKNAFFMSLPHARTKICYSSFRFFSLQIFFMNNIYYKNNRIEIERIVKNKIEKQM